MTPRTAPLALALACLLAAAAPAPAAPSEEDADAVRAALEKRYIELAVELGRLEALRDEGAASREAGALVQLTASAGAETVTSTAEQLALAEAELRALRERLARASRPQPPAETPPSSTRVAEARIVLRPLPTRRRLVSLPPTANPEKLAALELRLGNAAEARAVLETAGQTLSDTPTAQFVRAQVLERTGAFDAAVESYSRVARAREDDLLGVHAAWCERYARWRKQWNERLRPLEGWAAFEQAKRLEREGRRAQARAVYARLAANARSSVLREQARWSLRLLASGDVTESAPAAGQAPAAAPSQPTEEDQTP